MEEETAFTFIFPFSFFVKLMAVEEKENNKVLEWKIRQTFKQTADD